MNFSLLNEVVVVMFVAIFWLIPLRVILGFFERKLVADFQARIGPTQSGASGAFQVVFDFFRIVQKEVACEVHWGAVSSFSLVFAATLVSLYGLTFPSFAIDFLLPFTLQLLGTVLGTASIRDQWIEGVRRCALAAVGVVPILLGVICVGLESGESLFQAAAPAIEPANYHWNLFSNPFLALAALAFFLGSYQLFVVQTQQESGWLPSYSSVSKRFLGNGVGGDLQLLEGMVRFLSRINLGIWFTLLFLGGWREYPFPVVSWIVFSVKVSVVYLAMRFFGVIGSEQKTLQRLRQSWRFTYVLGFFALMGQVLWRWVTLT